jgi:hypothetical protein
MTPTQLTALRAACFLDANAAAFFAGQGNAAGLRAYLNAASGTNVWRTEAPTVDILDAVDQSRYTPNDPVLQTNAATDSLLRLNARALYAQTKLMVLQNFVLSRQALDCRPATVRGSLRDAVIQVPTGVDGAAMQPGGASGVNVLNKCVRSGTRAEVMLAAAAQGSDTTGGVTARVMTFEGEVADLDAATLIYRDDGSIWTA